MFSIARFGCLFIRSITDKIVAISTTYDKALTHPRKGDERKKYGTTVVINIMPHHA